MPGLSVSVARRWHETIKTGDVGDGNPGELETDLEVTSLRAMLGKNWFVLGLMVGAGWDRYAGQATVSAAGGVDDPGAVSGQLASERTVYFASAWYNFLVSQLSAEVGVADGVSDPFDGRAGAYDPASWSWFASFPCGSPHEHAFPPRSGRRRPHRRRSRLPRPRRGARPGGVGAGAPQPDGGRGGGPRRGDAGRGAPRGVRGDRTPRRRCWRSWGSAPAAPRSTAAWSRARTRGRRRPAPRPSAGRGSSAWSSGGRAR